MEQVGSESLQLINTYQMNNGFAVALVGKNLIENSYYTAITEGVNGEYLIAPTYIASASYNHRLFTLGFDIDLNETEGYTAIDGTLNGFNAFDWA